MTLSTGDNKVYFVDLFMHKKGKYCSRLNNFKEFLYIYLQFAMNKMILMFIKTVT